MKAIYTRDANCQICMEMYPECTGEGCQDCVSMRRETVEVLDFVKNLFGASAIVMFKDGTLQMVPINSLKMQDVEP